jgi:hypothetical protein
VIFWCVWFCPDPFKRLPQAYSFVHSQRREVMVKKGESIGIGLGRSAKE